MDFSLALLFMDVVSSGELVIQGFTCAVESENEEEEEDDEPMLKYNDKFDKSKLRTEEFFLSSGESSSSLSPSP